MAIKTKYAAIREKLTLEQKCTLLSGADVFKTREEKSAGIPSIWLTDGPHGLRKQMGASDHLGLNPSEPATCFPTAAAVACSWDEALGEKIGEALGREAAAQEVNVVLGPGLNIKRNPLCGRNFEYFSEDPYLSGKLAAAYIRGIQKNGLAACPKHFAVNNQETRRMVSDSILDERTLREIYLTGFEIAVKEGKPKSIMSSYNLVNGVYANENQYLLKDILRKEWGFAGAVVTDWGCSNDHALGVKAGSSLEMPAPGLDSVRELLKAVHTGTISEQDVDDRLEELLELVFSTKEALETAPKEFGKEAHHKLAYRAAAESLTLLKNENDFLPLKKGTKVALIGGFAAKPRYQGTGSSMVNAYRVDIMLDKLKASELELIGYAEGYERFGRPDEARKAEAVLLARKAEAVILCLGLDEVQENEGLDRKHMRLAKNQTELLHAIAKVNPSITVVLFSGCCVETFWRGDCKAILYTALGGQAGAGAVADALTGKVNPGGKLAETWPESYEDTPSKEHFAGSGRRVEYREGLYVGYRYYESVHKAAAFPFGFGLSYTSFAYSGLEADKEQVSFILTNTGKREGAEISQLYVKRPQNGIFGPVKELKGFARTLLGPGESKRVIIPLDDKAFRYWNTKTKHWETAGGDYILSVGSSCEEERLCAVVRIEGSKAPDPYEGKELSHYRTGKADHIPDREFETLMEKMPEPEKKEIDRNITFGEINRGRSPVGWIAWAVLTYLLNRSMKKGKPSLNLFFIYNMPLRALAKMTNGIVSMGMIDGMVMELKGFWVLGFLRVLLEFIKNLTANSHMEKRLKTEGKKN